MSPPDKLSKRWRSYASRSKSEVKKRIYPKFFIWMVMAERPQDNNSIKPIYDWAKRVDQDRFRSALFARGQVQPALMALYAFNGEVARAREAVSEPMIGEIRLQWWVEVLDQIYNDQPIRKHPVAEAMGAAIRTYHLPRAPFDALIEARRFDLYDEPMADHKALINYVEATSSGLMALAAKICGAEGGDEPSGPFGRAYGLTGLLLAAPYHKARNQTFIPANISADELAAHILTEVKGIKLPKQGRAAYLPAALIKGRLKAIAADRPDMSDLAKLSRMMWANLSGRL